MNAPTLEGFPLSPQQRRLWTLQSAEPVQGGGGSYRAIAVVRLEGELDQEALRSALATVVARHEILRTAFRCLPAVSYPFQVITDSGPAWWPDRELGGDVRLAVLDLEAGSALQAQLAGPAPGGERLLTLVLPALCADARALGHLVADLSRCYAHHRAGRCLDEPPIQYADVAGWLNELLEAEDTEAGREYWRNRALTGSTPAALPFAMGRSGDTGVEPGRAEASLSGALAAACRSLCERWDAKPESLFLAAWQILLWRLTGEAEPAVAIGSEGRNFAELEEAIGLFDRYLPVAFRLDAGLGIPDVLARTGRALREARERLELFTWEQWAAEGRSNLDYLPLAFEYLEATPRWQEAGLVFSLRRRESHCDRFALKLACAEKDGTFAVEVHSDPQVVPSEDAWRVADRFRALLDSLAAHPERRIGDLELLSAAERQELIVELNATRLELPTGVPIHRHFERHAEQHPDRVAISCEEGEVRYGELEERANRLAHHLRRHGIGPETLVAVGLERAPEMVVALLAVLKAGGAYVPLDGSYPRERLAFMVEDSRPAVLLTTEEWRAALPEEGLRRIWLDRERELIAAESGARLSEETADAGGEALAYVIYTSGSTGRPKGVAVSRRAIANRLLWMQRAFPLGAGDGVVQKTPISFDASIWEIFLPLLSGTRLVLARPDGHQDSAYLASLVRRQKATVLQLVPSMLQILAEEPELAQCDTLRWIFSGGEALPAELERRCRARSAAELVNLYGPTEAAIDATSWICSGSTNQAIVPIGRPIANVQVYIVDEQLRLTPRSVPGELLIGGAGLARGYLAQPDLTAARFVPDPFGLPGGRLFKTGDLARHGANGEIEFLGRLDFQVKLRGFRIELGEIEETLAGCPGVRRAVVVANPGRTGQPQLVAYLVTSPDGAPSPEELSRFLSERLPDFMVPSLFVTLDDLPLTPSGKIDRRALPAPEAVSGRPERVHVAPRTLTEQLLAGIWSEVLGVEAGTDDGFFELGGNSLVATQLTSRLRKVFKVELPIRAVFEAPTIRQLAERVEMLLKSGEVFFSPPLERAPRGGHLPLSFAQQRLWFLNHLEAGASSYNLPMSVRLRGPLSVAALAAAFAEIVRRHEVLRTTYSEEEGRPVQIIGPALPPALPVGDLTVLPAASRQAEVARLAGSEARRPFDLARGPLLRALLLRVDEDEHVAVFTMHHIASDGWSLGVLLREMGALYGAARRGLPSPLPELPLQYADFAAWQRSWLQAEVLAAQIAYWEHQLAGLPPLLALPTDRPRPAQRSSRGDRRSLALPSAVARDLRALSRPEGVTLFMTLLAACQVWLQRVTGQADVAIGTPIANRNRTEIEGLIGFFANTLVLRTDLSGDPSFREALRRARDVALGASAHQDLPFERLVDALQPERNLSHTPLFQVLFVFQQAGAETTAISDLALTPVNAHSGTSKFDLTLDLVDSGRDIAGVVEYSTDLFDGVTVERLIDGFLVLLAGIAADPGCRLSAFPLLGEAETHQVLREWNDTATAYPLGILLHELFEAQVRRTPDAPAVSAESGTLTYRELDRRAARLAWTLRGLGCGPGSVVAVLLERSLEMVVALLGVLKAGSAYLPLDPEYPVERLAWMRHDAAAPVLLAQERLLERLPRHDVQVLCLEEGWGAGNADAVPAEAPPRDAGEDDLAYVIYTSGSTGRPKGVGVSHRAIVNRLLWMQQAYGLTSADRVLQKTPASFDVSVWEFFWPLASGAHLVMARPGGHRDGAYLADVISRAGVTVLHFVPSMLQLFLEQADLTGCAGLRLVVASGEALGPDLRQRFIERLDARLENLYGPTEAAVDVTSWDCRARTPRGGVPIGRPIANLRIYLLDRSLQPVPRGIAGELIIAGVGLARGYLGRPDLTAERFIPDAWGDAPGARAYRTGDLARALQGGEVEYMGRLDNQVKVRGFRIELGEIETILGQHAAVRETAVLARRDTPGEARLVAYVVPETEPAPAHEELRAYLRERLPDYMLPAAFVFLPALPLSGNGKLDRGALPAPGPERPEIAAIYTPPRDALEEALAASWAEALSLEKVGIDDNFFTLGGDSMRIVQVISRLEKRGWSFSVQQLYQQQTVRGLATVAVAVPPSPEPELSEEAELELLLAELDGLSEEEVRARIQQRMPAEGDEVKLHE